MSTSTQRTILFLAANPKRTDSLRLGEECRRIKAALKLSKYGYQFNLQQEWAVRIKDLRRAVLDLEPQILHFSGHGGGDDGLVLEDETGNVKFVSGKALAELLGLFPKLNCVVLNGCYTTVQAQEIVKHIPYVIGMGDAIVDKAARIFTEAFYDSLGAGQPIEVAFKIGKNAIEQEGLLNEASIPELLTKPPVSQAVSAVLNTLPPIVDEWQGRQAELAELEAGLSNDNIHLLGITAAGGYGKSALAVKLTDNATGWRVLWLSFTQAYSFAQVGRWLLEQLGQVYDERWDEVTLRQQMVAGLSQAEQRCLVVLDNLETVLRVDDSYEQFLSQWAAAGHHSKIIITSREKPQLSRNLQRRCHWLPLQGLAEPDAVRLVTEDYGLTGTDEELAVFVNQMGRHPLLMQLVCSLMVDQLGDGAVVAQVQQLDLDLFSVSGYHRNLETNVGEVVAASLARLSSVLVGALSRLSVLRTGFDLSLAQGIVPEITEANLRQLGRLSLLQETPPHQGKTRQFQFLPLIQTFVQQQAESSLLESAHHSALAYFQSQFTLPPWESLGDIAVYLEAFYHAGELGEWQLAYDFLNEDRGGEGKDKSINKFLDFQGFNRQRGELYEQVVRGSEPEQDCYRNSLNLLGLCYDSLGRYEEAIAHHQQHHDISKEIGDRQGVAISLGNLGICYHSLGRYEEAIAHHQQNQGISKEISDRQGVAISLDNLGNCYNSLGRYEEAIDNHQQSLAIKKEIGDRQGVAISLGNLGNCYDSLGRYEEAIDNHQQSLAIKKEIGDRQGIAISLGNLGNCYDSLGRYEEAIAHHQKHHDMSKEIGDQQGGSNFFIQYR